VKRLTTALTIVLTLGLGGTASLALAAGDHGAAGHEQAEAGQGGDAHRAEAHEEGGHDGEHHDAGIDWFELGSMVANFVLLFGFLAVVLRPTVRNALVARRQNLSERLEEAQKKQADAEARLEEYKTKMENLEAEFQQVLQSYEAQAKADRERLEAETEKALERMGRENEFTIQQEIRKIEKSLQTSAAQETLRRAEELVKERITDADQRRLTDEWVSQLREQA